jgi:hypothetical protein
MSAPIVGASPRAIVLLTSLALVAGGLAGALIEHRLTCRECDAGWSRGGASWKEDQVARWSRALRLTPPQQAELVALLDEMKPQYDSVYASVRARRASVDRSFEDRLRRIASGAEQSARLERMLARDAERRSQYYGPAPVAEGVAQPASDEESKSENAAQ